MTLSIAMTITMPITTSIAIADITSPAYLDAYSRINGVVVIGEGLADRHFRLLAKAIPADGPELLRLAAMEGRHAREFIGCGHHLGIKPDLVLAKQLFDPYMICSWSAIALVTWRDAW